MSRNRRIGTIHTGTLHKIERLNCSASGNPRYRLTLHPSDDGYLVSWNTATDYSFNYDIGNPGYRVGSPVTLIVGGRGTITSIHKGV